MDGDKKKREQLRSFTALVAAFITGLMGCIAVMVFTSGVSTFSCTFTVVFADLSIVISTGIKVYLLSSNKQIIKTIEKYNNIIDTKLNNIQFHKSRPIN